MGREPHRVGEEDEMGLQFSQTHRERGNVALGLGPQRGKKSSSCAGRGIEALPWETGLVSF